LLLALEYTVMFKNMNNYRIALFALLILPNSCFSSGTGLPDLGYWGNILFYMIPSLLVFFVKIAVVIFVLYFSYKLLLKSSAWLSNNKKENRYLLTLIKFITLGLAFSLTSHIGLFLEMGNCNHNNMFSIQDYLPFCMASFVVYLFSLLPFTFYAWKKGKSIQVILPLIISAKFILLFYLYAYIVDSYDTNVYYYPGCEGVFKYTIGLGPFLIIIISYVVMILNIKSKNITKRSS